MTFNKPAMARSTVPYDTGKVQIGLLYFPKQSWSPSRDAFNLQTALLCSSTEQASVPRRLANLVWKLL